MVKVLLISLGTGALVALISEWAQMGFSVAICNIHRRYMERMQSTMSSIQHQLRSFLAASVYTVLLLCISYHYGLSYRAEILSLLFAGPMTWRYIVHFFIWILGTLCVCACVDMCWMRFRYFRGLRMSSEELKRDQREEEGDPHLRAKRKALHHGMVTQDLIARVKKARVVVIQNG